MLMVRQWFNAFNMLKVSTENNRTTLIKTGFFVFICATFDNI